MSRLGESQESSLTTDQANLARSLWINLHWTKEEADEYGNIRKRLDVLLENAKARSWKRIPDEQAEWERLSERSTYLAHDVGMKRCIANNVMRDQVWPELVPRVLRFSELADKPEDTLQDAEMRKLNDLTKWFLDLRAKAVESAEKQLRVKSE